MGSFLVWKSSHWFPSSRWYRIQPGVYAGAVTVNNPLFAFIGGIKLFLFHHARSLRPGDGPDRDHGHESAWQRLLDLFLKWVENRRIEFQSKLTGRKTKE